MMINEDKDLSQKFLRLVEIMNELREKCPWDRKQTVQTLRHMTIEETYELADAITTGSWKGIREELGDLLLHIIFYSRIGREEGEFSLSEVIDGISTKLVERHPHIYGNVKVNDEEDVKRNWERLKLKEGKSSILDGVPKALPSTVKAMRLQEKAKQVGFEWENTEQVWEKVKEELDELQHAVESSEPARMEEELGDVFFSLINYARFLRVDAENALEVTNKKFIDRFKKMEKAAGEQGRALDQMTLGEMDDLWNSIKRK